LNVDNAGVVSLNRHQQLRNIMLPRELECIYVQFCFLNGLWRWGHDIFCCQMGQVLMILKHPTDISIGDDTYHAVIFQYSCSAQTIFGDIDDNLSNRVVRSVARLAVRMGKVGYLEVKLLT